MHNDNKNNIIRNIAEKYGYYALSSSFSLVMDY